MRLSPEDIGILFLSLAVFLFFARIFGEIFIRFKLPAVIGEIIAGIILGPTLLGSIFSEAYNAVFSNASLVSLGLDTIAQIAIALLLLVSGMEVDLGLVFRQGKNSVIFGTISLILPFLVGFIFGYFYLDLFVASLASNKISIGIFFGLAIGISALPVIARILLDLKMLRTEIGTIILSSAMFIDLFGWMIFSLLVGSMKGGMPISKFFLSLLYVVLFAFLTVIILGKIIDKIIPYLQKEISFPGGILNFIFILCFTFAYISELIGIHSIFGAFIVGITFGNSPVLKENVKQILNQFITNIFAPLFFISIGLRVDFSKNLDLIFILIFLFIAIAVKIAAGIISGKLAKFELRKSLAIGSALNARGAMEIILGLIALDAGLIDEIIYVALVITALFTSIITPVLMKLSLKKYSH
jgi:Kef-type K+ transport system membrane component KefB